MTDQVDTVRGPQAEWIDSKCPVCGKFYFGAALEYAPRLHDKHEQGRCQGRLEVIPDRIHRGPRRDEFTDQSPPSPVAALWELPLYERRRMFEGDWSTSAFAERLRSLRPDQPCGHPGCLHHVSHPCEGCGRIAGRWPEEKQP